MKLKYWLLLWGLTVCGGNALSQSRVGPDLIERARTRALSYVSELPNFLCKQRIQRYVIFDLSTREVLDEVVLETAFYEGAEQHTVLTVGGKPAPGDRLESLTGLTSRGEFGSSLAALFDPETRTVFEPDGQEKLRGRQTARFRFTVPAETSRNQISLGSVAAITAYRGRCWVDVETGQVLRLEDQAVDIPADLPVTASSSRTEYDRVEIAGNSYWLPVSANVRVVAESKPGRPIFNFYEVIMGKMALPNFNPPRAEAVNLIRFEDYRKFQADVKITF
ncbi:MAG: hypothetical protein Kow001_11670 [Acidobacteriota bacterium]